MISKKLYCNQVGYEYANMGKLSNNIGLNSDHNINGTYLSNGIREKILKESRSELGKQICTQIILTELLKQIVHGGHMFLQIHWESIRNDAVYNIRFIYRHCSGSGHVWG